MIPNIKKGAQSITSLSAGGCTPHGLRIRGLVCLLTFNWLSATVSTVLAVDRDAQPPERSLTYVDFASTPRPDCLVAFDQSYKNHLLVHHPFDSERRFLDLDPNVTVCTMGKGGKERNQGPGGAEWKGKASKGSKGKDKGGAYERSQTPIGGSVAECIAARIAACVGCAKCERGTSSSDESVVASTTFAGRLPKALAVAGMGAVAGAGAGTGTGTGAGAGAPPVLVSTVRCGCAAAAPFCVRPA